MEKKVVLLPGDGVGPEVTREAVKVMHKAAEIVGLSIQTEECLVGGACIDAHQTPLQDATLDKCHEADAVFLGAVGGPKWDHVPKDIRPETGLLRLRKELGLYTNLRPVKVYDSLLDASPLKPEHVKGIDLLVVRELTGGIYFGGPRKLEEVDGRTTAADVMEYSCDEIRRIARAGFDAARLRRKQVISVDKANILVSSQLWRKTVDEVAEEYPDIALSHMLVDNCAMQLIRNPGQFDVLLTENMFGDILSDEAAMLSGSIGLLPSASLGDSTGLYEPVHGSAPDIAGKNLANPLAAITSVAMMFRYSFHEERAASAILNALEAVLNKGFRTSDIQQKGCMQMGTIEMGDQVVNAIKI